jgi:hypothetical protein
MNIGCGGTASLIVGLQCFRWYDMRGCSTTALPLPAGLALDAASWEQTPLVVRPFIVHLLAVIQQPAIRIAALDARVSPNSSNAARPPSSDPPDAKWTTSSATQGRSGAEPGHPGHRRALLTSTEVIAVTCDFKGQHPDISWI